MMPLRFGPLRGTPSTCTPPVSGARKPAMMFISVVLPQPEGPTIATNSPSAISKFRSWMTSSRPLSVGKPLPTALTKILPGIAPAWPSMRIAPPHDLHVLEQPHDAVERKPDQSDDDHAGNHEVVAVPRVARVDDHVPEPGAQRDHLGGDDHEPGDAEPDAHADDDLRQRRREDHLQEQLLPRDTEIVRSAQESLLDRVHAGRGLHDHREHGRDEDEVDRRRIADTEPEDGDRDPRDRRDG